MSREFVPFCDTVIHRYANRWQLPSHGVMDKRLLHGQITVTITARTPIMVSDGSRVKEGPILAALFSRDAQGRYRIPGSTLRGLIRQNMQILGLGALTIDRGEDISPDKVYGGAMPWNGMPGSHSALLADDPRDDPEFHDRGRKTYVTEYRGTLDYPRSIMGFVMREYQPRNKPRTLCYRSRISVGDLTALGAPRELSTVPVNQTLPRQSDPDFIQNLGKGRFRLSGFRQYPPMTVRSEPWDSRQGIRPLDAGTRFTGVIRYRNLHSDELGLLLWCLRLEEGCVHAMGMAKGYGYGQVSISIDALTEFDPSTLYGSLTATGTPAADTAARVEQLIQTYRRFAANPGFAGRDPAVMPHIRTFLDLHRP